MRVAVHALCVAGLEHEAGRPRTVTALVLTATGFNVWLQGFRRENESNVCIRIVWKMALALCHELLIVVSIIGLLVFISVRAYLQAVELQHACRSAGKALKEPAVGKDSLSHVQSIVVPSAWVIESHATWHVKGQGLFAATQHMYKYME